MEKRRNRMFLILNTADDAKIIFLRIVVGLVFISEGIQKYLFLQVLGPALFQDIGFQHATFWAYFTGAFEMTCGLLVMVGLVTRFASIPLFIIMITAFIRVKLPLLHTQGFWNFAHQYNIEFALTILLVVLFLHGGGKWSADSGILRAISKKAEKQATGSSSLH